ncbi:MAG: hypothetical protein P4L40_24745 [Terracidiphilus sp.]|nr:hypothetical protein [Terracidiphilus sp.]
MTTVSPTPSLHLLSPHAVAVALSVNGTDVLYIVSDANVVHILDVAKGALLFGCYVGYGLSSAVL